MSNKEETDCCRLLARYLVQDVAGLIIKYLQGGGCRQKAAFGCTCSAISTCCWCSQTATDKYCGKCRELHTPKVLRLPDQKTIDYFEPQRVAVTSVQEHTGGRCKFAAFGHCATPFSRDRESNPLLIVTPPLVARWGIRTASVGDTKEEGSWMRIDLQLPNFCPSSGCCGCCDCLDLNVTDEQRRVVVFGDTWRQLNQVLSNRLRNAKLMSQSQSLSGCLHSFNSRFDVIPVRLDVRDQVIQLGDSPTLYSAEQLLEHPQLARQVQQQSTTVRAILHVVGAVAVPSMPSQWSVVVKAKELRFEKRVFEHFTVNFEV